MTFRLGLLDGTKRCAFLLWRLPDDVAFDRVALSTWPVECIQCAGGASGRFTCEMRVVRSHGAQHLVVGRRGAADLTDQATEVVRWAEHETTVRPHEVLDLSDLTEVFRSYLQSGGIPDRYVTRVRAP